MEEAAGEPAPSDVRSAQDSAGGVPPDPATGRGAAATPAPGADASPSAETAIAPAPKSVAGGLLESPARAAAPPVSGGAPRTSEDDGATRGRAKAVPPGLGWDGPSAAADESADGDETRLPGLPSRLAAGAAGEPASGGAAWAVGPDPSNGEREDAASIGEATTCDEEDAPIGEASPPSFPASRSRSPRPG